MSRTPSIMALLLAGAAAPLLGSCGIYEWGDEAVGEYEREVQAWQKASFERCDAMARGQHVPGSYPPEGKGSVVLEVRLQAGGHLWDVQPTKVNGLTVDHVHCLMATVAETPYRELERCTEGDDGEPEHCTFRVHHVVAATAEAPAGEQPPAEPPSTEAEAPPPTEGEKPAPAATKAPTEPAQPEPPAKSPDAPKPATTRKAW